MDMEQLKTGIAVYLVFVNPGLVLIGGDYVQNNDIDAEDFVYSVSVTQGESMEPVINEGDLLIVDNGEMPSEGDIVAFKGQNRAIAHEYMGGGVAKGVNNEEIDPVQVTDKNTIGTVEVVIPTSEAYNVVFSVLR